MKVAAMAVVCINNRDEMFAQTHWHLQSHESNFQTSISSALLKGRKNSD